MKDISIFQIYFNEESEKYLDPAFIPHLNKKSDGFFENTVIKEVYDKFQKPDALIPKYVGTTSWKQKQKTGFDGQEIISHIQKDIELGIEKDVYLFTPISNVILKNEGVVPPQFVHNGIIKEQDIWLMHKNNSPNAYRTDVRLEQADILPFKLIKGKWCYCHCNYWVAKKEVFDKYCETYLLPALEWLSRPDIKRTLGSFTHHDGREHHISTYVLEGTFGSFLANSDYSYSYIYRKKTGRRLYEKVNIVGFEREGVEGSIEIEMNKNSEVSVRVASEKNLEAQALAEKKYKKDVNNPSVINQKIVAYTSLSPSPRNKETQLAALESWHELGMEVFCLNSKEEVEELQKTYPDWVNFVVALKTTKHIFGKHYVLINEMLDNFNHKGSADILMLINSDIILKPSNELIKKVKCISDVGLIISSREDYKESYEDGKKYESGFDVFFIHRKFIDVFPASMYSMGQTWWDYWIPYTAIKNDIPLFKIEEPFAFHKAHPIQYATEDWKRMTEYFKFENDISEPNPQTVNNTILSSIKINSIKI